MITKLTHLIAIVFISGVLIACSSPEEKAAEYIENADVLFEEGKLQKAELEYKNALQISQNLPEAWYGLARINERKQEWRKAYAVLNKIRELAPNHIGGRIMLAQILLASGQIDQALTDAKEILELAPDNAQARALMAAVQFRLENNSGAREEIEKALAIEPDNKEALLVKARVFIAEKSFDEAIELLDRSIAATPENVSYYLMKIQALQESGDQSAIEQVYLAMVKQFPENLAFRHALARLYLQQENIDKAEEVLQQIVESNPDNVDEKVRLVAFKSRFRSAEEAITLVQTYIETSGDEYRYRFLLGELHEGQQQPDQAREVYQAIVDEDGLNTNGIEARNKISMLELRSGNEDKAKSVVEEVLTHDKANENALLVQASFMISERNFDDAIVNARTVLRDNPGSVRALGLLGQAYEATRSFELAEESYTKALQINRGAAPIANQLAKLLIRKREFVKADGVLMESFSGGSRSLEGIKLLAQVKLALGEWDKAEELAKQLKNIEGQEAASQQVLGIVYLGKEQQEDSILAFKKAHELSPESTQPIVALVRTYMSEGKVSKARDFLNSVLELNSENVAAYLLLSQISLYERNIPEAIAHLNKSIEVNPGVDTSYRRLASIYIAQNELDKAEGIINQGLEALPDLPSLSLTLASIYERRQNFAKAIATYEKMLEINPDQVVAKNNLASLLTDYGDGQQSIERARNMSAEFKSSPIPQFRDTYAWASVKSGLNLEEAVVILEGIVEENQQVGVYHYHLGEAYRKTGNNDNAVIYLTKAVELTPPGSDVAEKANRALQQIK